MSVNIWFLSEEALLSATFEANKQTGVLEIHDHRGCALSTRGDEELWISGFYLMVNDELRNFLDGKNDTTGNDLRNEGFLKK